MQLAIQKKRMHAHPQPPKPINQSINQLTKTF
jgi:hypothetical protein